MSSSHYQVYAAATHPMAVVDVADEVGSITGAAMTAMPWPGQEAYRGDTASCSVIVTDHDLVESDGIPFPAYPYEIELWSHTGDRSAELRTAEQIRNALERSGRYRTMITWDAQVRIDPE